MITLLRARILIFTAIALVAGAVTAEADPVGFPPDGEENRMRFSCATARGELFRYILSGVVAWNGDDGKANFVLMRDQEPNRVVVSEFSLDVKLVDTGLAQIIRSAAPTTDDDLSITWRSDFAQRVPVFHYLKIRGRRYAFVHCKSDDGSQGDDI